MFYTCLAPQVRNEMGEERRSAIAAHSEALQDMQRKLQAVEAMVCSKDAQVSMLQVKRAHRQYITAWQQVVGVAL